MTEDALNAGVEKFMEVVMPAMMAAKMGVQNPGGFDLMVLMETLSSSEHLKAMVGAIGAMKQFVDVDEAVQDKEYVHDLTTMTFGLVLGMAIEEARR